MAWDSAKPRIDATRLLMISFILLAMPWTQVSGDKDSSPYVETVVTPQQEYYDVADNVTFQELVRFEIDAFDTNSNSLYQIKISFYEEYDIYGEAGKIISQTYSSQHVSLSLDSLCDEWVNGTNYTFITELFEQNSGEEEYILISNNSYSFIVGKSPVVDPPPVLSNVEIKCDEDWKITQNDTRLQADDSAFALNCSAQNNNAVRVLSQLQIMGYPTPDIDAGIEFQVTLENPSIDGNGSTTNFTLRPKGWNLSMIIPNGSVSIQINVSAIGWQSNETIFEINYTIEQEIIDTPAEPVIILGCTDTLALNFDPGATDDDDSCEYPEPIPPDCPICNFTYQIPSQVSVDTPATFSADATLSEGWDYYGGATISWGFDGTIVNGAEVEHTYTSVPADGRTNVTMCVQFTDGPESCQEEMITVNLSLAGYISHSSQLEPLTSDAVGAIHFSIEVWGGQAPYSYEWQFGDGTTSTNHSVVHDFFETGMHNVSLEIIDGRGDSINLSAQIDIVDSDGNEGDDTKTDEIEELPIKPNTFAIAFTGGGMLFLSTLMYSNGKKKREKILKKGRLLAQKSSSLSADSYWDDSIK
tara:strand:- start:1225 stop:2979 length:1755 start_codon:yes stop_codon:yes gene_type:complete